MDTGSKVAITGAASWAQCTMADADRVQQCVIEVRGDDAWLTLAPIENQPPGSQESPAGVHRPPAALALLPSGGLLRFDTATGELRRYEPSGPDRLEPPWTPAFDTPAATAPGSFGPEVETRTAGNYTAAALDQEGVLTLVDSHDGGLLILDLVDRAVLGRILPDAPALDVALDPSPDTPCSVIVLVDDKERPLRRLEADGRMRVLAFARPPGLPVTARPARVAAGGGNRWVLWAVPGVASQPATGIATQASGPVRDRLTLPGVTGATELEVAGDGAVVLGRGPGADLARFLPAQVQAALQAGQEPLPEWLRAPGYDAHGLVRTATGRVGFWTPRGLRTAYARPTNRRAAGFAISYPLDGGGYHQRWGRIFVDACLPTGTGLRVAALTADEPFPHPSAADFPPSGPLVPRDLTDTPWLAADDGPVTYESVVHAPPGRFLWLRLDLTGTCTAVPEVLAVRVERPSAHLIDKLPAVYSAEPASADFLDRYLGLLSGPLRDLELAAGDRAVLLDPETTPTELLPWLAGLVGLTLDDRWPLTARRKLASRAVALFRRRGTIAALAEMIEILIGSRPTIVEQYRYRGVDDPHRIGDGYADYAHRFTVVVPVELDDDRQGALLTLLDGHRPAHTLVRLCTLGSARVGLGLHLGVTAMVAAGEAYIGFTVGHPLDGRSLLGRRRRGVRPGTSTIGSGEALVLR